MYKWPINTFNSLAISELQFKRKRRRKKKTTKNQWSWEERILKPGLQNDLSGS